MRFLYKSRKKNRCTRLGLLGSYRIHKMREPDRQTDKEVPMRSECNQVRVRLLWLGFR